MFTKAPGWEPPVRIPPTDPWRCYKCGAPSDKLAIYGRAFRLEYARCTKCGQRHARKMLPEVVKSGPMQEREDKVEKKPLNMTLTKVDKAGKDSVHTNTIKNPTLKVPPPIGGE